MTDAERLKQMQTELAYAIAAGTTRRYIQTAIAKLTAKMEHEELVALRAEVARLRALLGERG